MSSRIKQCENGITELEDKNAFKDQLLKGTLQTTGELKKWFQYLPNDTIQTMNNWNK